MLEIFTKMDANENREPFGHVRNTHSKHGFLITHVLKLPFYNSPKMNPL